MRRVMSAAAFLFVCPIALAQHFHHMRNPAPGDQFRGSPCCKPFAPAVLQPPLQKVKWEVTGSKDALPYFWQGMTQYYGFNYEEALRNFRKAAEVDPHMAMASWGIALAAGPNINLGMDRKCHNLASDESAAAVQKAKTWGATAEERAVIDALPLRYNYQETSDPVETARRAKAALQAYSDALASKWSSFKTEPNYGALYAESLVELHPWDLYENKVPTSPDTEKARNALKDAMKADKDAVGANHYWIHVAEAGPDPREALTSANLLRDLVKGSGHLVHMPSHIYLLIGDYESAVKSNVQASGVDVVDYKGCCSGSFLDYSTNPLCPQLYYGHYLSHNYFFGSVAATFSGQSATAISMACDTRAHAQNFLVNEPGLERYITAPLLTLVANRNWEAIRKYPEPPADCYNQKPFAPDIGCHILRPMWNWAQGMAALSADSAENSYKKMAAEMEANKTALSLPGTWGNNDAWSVMMIGQSLLRARFLWDKNEKSEAFKYLGNAARYESSLTYDEPPQWFPSALESLGAAYLIIGKYDLAKATFDAEVKRFPGSGRALYGRYRALLGLKDKDAAPQARIDFCTAWKVADYTMSDKDLWPVREASDIATICSGSATKTPSTNTCVTPPWPPQKTGSCPQVTPVPPPPSCSRPDTVGAAATQ